MRSVFVAYNYRTTGEGYMGNGSGVINYPKDEIKNEKDLDELTAAIENEVTDDHGNRLEKVVITNFIYLGKPW